MVSSFAHLIVMSRAPIPGQTKTRLIPALGPQGAAQFHVACLSDLLETAAAWHPAGDPWGEDRSCTLSITPSGSWSVFAAAGIRLPPPIRVTEQRGGTLGERMVCALEDALKRAEVALLIGSDLPLLTQDHLDRAAASLWGATDSGPALVFGPSEDGGYYLVGVRRGVKDWQEALRLDEGGTGSVLGRTMARAQSSGLRVHLIGELPDADTPADLLRILDHPLAMKLTHRSGMRWLREQREQIARAAR